MSDERPRLIALPSLVLADRLDPSTPGDVLFLQYTSGSTSNPRGVMVSHANVLHNAAISRVARGPTALSWQPHYHDMGLIGYQLFPIILGGTAHLCDCALTPACLAEPPLEEIVAGIVDFLLAEGLVPAPPAGTAAASTVRG